MSWMKQDLTYEILFLESSDDVLIKRYKETRRFHPLSGSSQRVDKGIAEEREKLSFLKKKANYLLDTSHMLTRELKGELNKIFVENKEYKNLYITVLSFGFKYGIPSDADLVFDVRFLPNPYYIEELRSKSGNDKEVRDYVMENEKSWEFLEKLTDMIEFLIPNYVAEGKTQLVIGIGCTGGKHRSVTLANALYGTLQESEENYGVRIEHRDIEKDAITKGKIGAGNVIFRENKRRTGSSIRRQCKTLQACRTCLRLCNMCGQFSEDFKGRITLQIRHGKSVQLQENALH